MRKNFTRLVCVGIASFCMMTVFGQEKMPAVRNIFDEKSIRKLNEVELRADEETEYWWPDSVIYYDNLGKPTFKRYYDEKSRTAYWSSLENDIWTLGEIESSNGYSFNGYIKVYYEDINGIKYGSITFCMGKN